MFDIHQEQSLTLNEARTLPFLKGRRGNRISLCTMHRWRTRGVGGVVLETARVGGTIVTTTEAVLRFIDRLSQRNDTSTRPSPNRRQQLVRAEKRLDQAGI
jgi:hypothetical protein